MKSKRWNIKKSLHSRVLTTRPQIALTISLICFSTFYYICRISFQAEFRIYFLQELPILISLLIFLTVILSILPANGIRTAIVFTKSVIAVILTTPLSNYFILHLLISLTILSDFVLLLPGRHSLWLILSTNILLVLVKRPAYAWSYQLESMPSTLKVATFSILGLYSLVLWLLIATAESERQSADDSWRLNQAVKKLTESNLHFQDYVVDVEKKSIDDERSRITREIHDTVGYTFTNIRMMTEASLRVLHKDIEKTQVLLYQMRDQSILGMKETKQALENLRSLDLPEEPWLLKINNMINTFGNATGLETSVEYGNIPMNLPAAVFRVIYRVVQEGLTNAFRHGEAEHLEVIFNILETTLSIVIRDDGTGSDIIVEGIGFKGMKERLKPYNGAITAGNTREGFQLAIKMDISGEP